MASITIVSGCPGTGKTTLSRALAQASPAGLHFVTDTFYQFPVRLVEPTTPESRAQNTTIMKAIGRATAAFVEGGYDVVLEGIVGPWFLPTLVSEWHDTVPVEYVLLQVTLEEALTRVLRRDGPVTRARVYAMHAAFTAVEGYAQHVIATTGRTADEVRAEYLERRRGGAFLLPDSIVAP